MKLFRTTAQLLPPVLVGDRQGPPQQPVYVFIEAEHYRRAEHAVQQALSLFWGVPVHQVAVEQAWSEHQLLNVFALGDDSTGDARMFEQMSDQAGGIRIYLPPERTYFFVQPDTLQRLLAAQQLASQLGDWSASAPTIERTRALVHAWAAKAATAEKRT